MGHYRVEEAVQSLSFTLGFPPPLYGRDSLALPLLLCACDDGMCICYHRPITDLGLALCQRLSILSLQRKLSEPGSYFARGMKISIENENLKPRMPFVCMVYKFSSDRARQMFFRSLGPLVCLDPETREELKGTTKWDKRVSAKSAVFCDNLRLPNAVIPR